MLRNFDINVPSDSISAVATHSFLDPQNLAVRHQKPFVDEIPKKYSQQLIVDAALWNLPASITCQTNRGWNLKWTSIITTTCQPGRLATPRLLIHHDTFIFKTAYSMTPHLMTPPALKQAVFFMLAFGAALASASGVPVVLTPPDISSSVIQISKAGGDLCIVGEAMDPDGDLQARGKVIMFSPVANKVLWQQTVEAPDGNASIRMVACRSDGKYTYVGANVDTHSERSLSQTLAYVFKFDGRGKLLGKKEVVTGATNAFVYDIDVGSNGATVIGMMNNEKTAAKANGIYFASLDGDLKIPSLTRLATGAYQNGSIVKLSGNVALLGGRFLPADARKDAGEDYAVSKIAAGKYLFSVRPQKGTPGQIATAITATDDIVSLGVVGKASVLTAVSADGKTTQTMLVKSALCQTDAMSADAELVYAVRKSCVQPGSAAKLVTINRKTGVETVKAGLMGEPVFIFPLDAKIYVVSKKGDSSLLMQTVGKEE